MLARPSDCINMLVRRRKNTAQYQEKGSEDRKIVGTME